MVWRVGRTGERASNLQSSHDDRLTLNIEVIVDGLPITVAVEMRRSKRTDAGKVVDDSNDGDGGGEA